MMRIAVTGCNGFIGRHLFDDLLAHGLTPVGLARSNVALAMVRPDVETRLVYYASQDCDAALAGCDALVHLAGRRSHREDDPDLLKPFVSSDVPMLDSLLRAARIQRLKKVVIASSIAVYSKGNRTPYSEMEVPVPLNPYGTNKLMAETHAEFWSRKHDIPLASLRIAACYGHGERETAALMRFIGQASRGETLRVNHGGTFCIDQIYVGDVCSAIRAALERTEACGAFNIGAGHAYSIREMAETANVLFDNRDNLVVECSDDPPPENRDNHMDVAKAKKILKWQPEHDLAEGITAIRASLESKANDSR